LCLRLHHEYIVTLSAAKGLNVGSRIRLCRFRIAEDMKKIFYILLLFFNIAFVMPCPSSAATVGITVIQSVDNYHAGETYPVLFRLKILDGWFIHSDSNGTGEIIPTVLTFEDGNYIKVSDIKFPTPQKKKFEYLSDPIEIFPGEILAQADVAVSKDATLGMQTIKGRLSYQACSVNACRPPETIPVEWSLTIVSLDTSLKSINKDLFLAANTEKGRSQKSGSSPFSSDQGILLTLALIFLGGLALNLSPCIYPMIPITVSYFGGKSGRMKGETWIHGLFYLIGLSATNSTLGVVAALSGNMMGALLQLPATLIIIALIMALLGLSFFDLWEIRLPSGLNKIASKNYGGYFGTFFMGLTLGIIAAPCIGPFILGLFAYVGQKADPFFGFLCFFVLSIGMGLPVCILALFSGAMEKLPLSGDWMMWIRKLMGWVLIGMAAYMISPLLSGSIAKPVLFLAVSIAAGIHLGWLDKAGQAKVRFVYIKKVAGILIVLLGVGYFYSSYSLSEGIRWQSYDEGLLSKAAEEGKPVIIDFYADWCIPCRELDKAVFRDKEVVALSEKFVVMRLDLTTQQENQDKILKKYQVIGVPTIIFINKDGKEERNLRIESFVGKSKFLSAMEHLVPSNL
jgi:thioredoxin:protein disulfide reductase